MEERNSIPHLEHNYNLNKTVMERLEADLMETKRIIQETSNKHDRTMSDYLKAQAEFIQSFTKLNEAKIAREEFDEPYKSAVDCCMIPKKSLKKPLDSAE